ncbi:hypothetical protein BMS3Bbin14_00604 [bacterium BMS3Bbin14]|nr:hypothetical protein BMS3Bbin14_00604 [bacterium BMS3Bbin14]HDK43783.1 PilZ domain-containing protein [Desulfobacteraceae bacterium]HDL98375.1 PilZ domain-containing protein [Desulfobacteraceae bacterium]HDO31381.1 PilZ domain-containing protein [Desulfobacteraceae bacterium]
MKTNRRNSKRHQTMALMSNIYDGRDSFLGVVEDVSTTGLRVAKIPARFDDSKGKCVSLINGLVGDIKITMQPCWVRATNRGMYKMIGFKIPDPPPEWTKFVRETLHTVPPEESFGAMTM